jgi:hypothetical protein
MLSYLLAVLAAFGNATSSVLQRKASRDVPRNQNLSWRLIWRACTGGSGVRPP